MKFRINRADVNEEDFPIPVEVVGEDKFGYPIHVVEVTTLAELVTLCEKAGFPIILGMPGSKSITDIIGEYYPAERPPDADGWLTIYDSWLE